MCFFLLIVTLVGNGECLDANDNDYDFIVKCRAGTNTAEGCMEYCNDIDGFCANGVGFVITVNEFCYYTSAEGFLVDKTLFLFRNVDCVLILDQCFHHLLVIV